MNVSVQFFAYFSLFAFVVSLIIGIYIFTRFPRIAITRMFFNICLLLAGINFVEFQMRLAPTVQQAQLWAHLYAIWPFILATTIHFLLLFRGAIQKPLLTYSLVYLPAIIIFYIELTTNYISIKPIQTNWGYTTEPAEGNWFIFSSLWTISVLGAILFVSYQNFSLAIGIKKRQAFFIFIGLVINFLIGISTDFLFKIVQVNTPAVGYSYSIISFGLIAFAISKYHLFELTPESVAGKIISTISEMVFLVNSKKQIVEINPAALHVLKYSKEELIGKPIDSIVHNSDDLCATCCNIMSTKKSVDYDAYLLTAESKKIQVSLSCNPIFLDNKNDFGIVFIGRDSTERKKVEARLRNENIKLEDLVSKRTENLSKINSQLLVEISKYERTESKLLQTIQQLEQNERNKIAFFDNLAHEISTPVNAIIGFTDLLRDENNTQQDIQKYTTIIQNSSIQLQGIVKNVVSMATLNNNKEVVNLEEVNCNYILNGLQLLFKPKADKKKIEFTCFKKLRDEEAVIITDQIKLTQILSNLLTNAFKFTTEGYIHFGYSVSTDKITFFVRDTGIGIPEESKHKIFERYSQGNPTIAELFGGSGLGLSIAKTYVELLGGEISIESNTAKGSNFNFWLPYSYQIEKIH